MLNCYKKELYLEIFYFIILCHQPTGYIYVYPLLSKMCIMYFNKCIIHICYIYFRDTRSLVLEESLRKLGVERLGKEDVQKMQWEMLEAKIGNWIHYMRIAVRSLWKIPKYLYAY